MLRPDFQEGKINGIYVKNAKNVKAENLEVTVHDNMKEWVDKEICFENAVVKEKNDLMVSAFSVLW